jgi:hypothetical protein
MFADVGKPRYIDKNVSLLFSFSMLLIKKCEVHVWADI